MRKQIRVILMTMLAAGVSADASASFFSELPDTTSTELSELEVTGCRTPEEILSTSPVKSIDAETILTGGITDISDALRRFPGVTLRDYGGSGGMKTISVRGLGTQHTNVVYDGVVLGDVQGGQTDLSRYSLHNLGSMTLNIGDGDDISVPARTLSAATSLSISTLQNPDMLTEGPEFDLKLRAASFLTLNPYARFAISNGKNLGMAITGEYTHARNDYPFQLVNGKDKSNERRQNSQFNTGHIELNGVWKPTSSSKLHAKAYYYTGSRHLPGPVIYYNSVSNQRLNDMNAFGQLFYSTRLGTLFTLKAVAKYNYTDTRFRDVDGKYPGGAIDQRYKMHEQYVSANLVCRPASGLSLSYAADYWHNSLLSNLRGENRPQRNSVLQAISAKWNVWRLTATLHGLYSIVHDKAESLADGKTEQQFSPSASVSVRPLAGTQWRLRASYKNIFRMPTFNEFYFDHYGSVNLNPEKANQFNFGTTYELGHVNCLDRFTVTLDFYHNEVKNKIVAMPYNMFVMTMTNLGKVLVNGFDASLNIRIAPVEKHYINLESSYSYQRAVTRTDPAMTDWNRQVPYTPLNSGSWSVSWENPWVNAVIHGTGCSSRYSTTSNVPSSKIDGYMEMGVTLYRDFRIGKNTFSVRADMANALNTQYELIARYPMPGRSFSLTIEYKLN